jgi:hypothetical protein
MRINKSSRRGEGGPASSVIGFVICVLLMRTVDATSCSDRSSAEATKKKGRGWAITYMIWAELAFLFPRLRPEERDQT